MINLYKLPSKYHFNEDTINSGNYIDDGSLLVYYKLKQGWFSGNDTALSFIWGNPVEWNTRDLVAYLLKLAKEYNLVINNVQVMWGPIEDEYEDLEHSSKRKIPETDEELWTYLRKIDEYNKGIKSETIDKQDIGLWLSMVHKYDFKKYTGAYKWSLDQLVNNPEGEFSLLFARLKVGEATANDLEKLLIYSGRLVSHTIDERSEVEVEVYNTNSIANEVLGFISFSIEVTEDQKDVIRKDISNYLDLFITDKLKLGRDKIRIRDVSIKCPSNILNFQTHKKMFTDYLSEMSDKYGNEFTIKNIFEEEFPYLDDVETELMQERYRKKDFLFIHCYLAFLELNLIKTRGISSNWDALDVKPITYESQIQIQPPLLGQSVSKDLHFDPDTSRLFVEGNEIKILKFKDEYQTLKVIFEKPEDISKEWFFSEIGEKVDMYLQGADKKYYNAVYQTGLKLKTFGINDFFITTKQSVKINKKYLS